MDIVKRKMFMQLKYCVHHTKGVFRSINTVPHTTVDRHRRSKLAADKQEIIDEEDFKPLAPADYRYIYPEFLPKANWYYRDRISLKLEHRDMWRRRANLDIPEFYPGSVLAVTSSDPFSSTKENRFVGICLQREEEGLRANFLLRNHIDGLGIEIRYDLYNPTIQKIEVLLLEKRLDEDLLYLRNCGAMHSTFPFDMDPVIHRPGDPVPINDIVLEFEPEPWDRKWELRRLKGAKLADPDDKQLKIDRPYRAMRKVNMQSHPDAMKPWLKHDLMHHYRQSVNEEDMREIMADVQQQEGDLERQKVINERKTQRGGTNKQE